MGEPRVAAAWGALLEAQAAFRELAPWRWMYDTPTVGVLDPVTGRMGYCSVMGAGGDAFGLLVFRGAVGLWGYAHLLDEELFDTVEHRVAMHHLDMLSFALGARDEVANSHRKLYRELGYSFRGRMDWPVFNSLVPGYMNWTLDDDEAASMARFMKVVAAFAALIRDDVILRSEWERESSYPGMDLEVFRVLCIVPGDAADSHTLETEYGPFRLEWRKVTPSSPVRIDPMYNEIEMMSLKKRLRRADLFWEFDVWPAPIRIGGPRERPAAVEIAMCVESASGIVLGVEMSAGDDPSRPAAHLLQFIGTAGYIPAGVAVARSDVADGLAKVAKALGIGVRRAPQLPGMEEFYYTMIDHIGEA